jgi:hypothetical protein
MKAGLCGRMNPLTVKDGGTTRMTIEIKSRLSGSVLFSIETENLRLAVEAAVKSGANLSRADLSRANLSRADLSRANLSGANGVHPLLTTPLYALRDQVGPIRLYKLVDAEGRSPIQNTGKLTYRVGEEVVCPDARTDESEQCAAGINVATMDWCLREWCEGYRILVVEFEAKDIAAIPLASDGKIRLHRCRVVAEKNLEEIGWPMKFTNERTA